MGYGYYRVRGLHNASSSSKKSAKPDKRLEQLAKRELGSRAIKWIKDNLGDDFGSLGSFSVGGDLKERARALAGGLKKLDPRATKAGIAAILGNWNFESGGLNPSAVNSSGGASGLGQWLGGRLTNLKAYARRHGTSWKNAGTQLSFAVKGEGSDSAILRSILEGHGSVASLANRFSAEWERGGYNAQHVRGAMQVAKALGFAKGGRPKVGQNVIVGEHGPEIARFDSPVQIYSNEKSRRSLNLGKLPDVQHASSKKHFTGKFAPVININFNGSASDFDSKQARKIAEIVQRELEKVFNSIDEEFC
nr:phage tail tip lysozyme [Lactobacillus amylovorus]